MIKSELNRLKFYYSLYPPKSLKKVQSLLEQISMDMTNMFFLQPDRIFDSSRAINRQFPVIIEEFSDSEKQPIMLQIKSEQQTKLLPPTQGKTISDLFISKKEQTSHESKNYQKNVAGYIFKKIASFIEQLPRKNVKKLLHGHTKFLQQLVLYFQKQSRKNIGLKGLFEQIGNPKEKTFKFSLNNIFRRFMRFYYLYIALSEGKMKNLRQYLRYKNKFMLYIDRISSEKVVS